MNILAVHGSMRKGNTYALAQAVIKRLQTHGDVELTEISVADLELPFCRSCHVCFVKGEEYCPHFNAVGRVRAAFNAADGVILSGVTYAMGLNAAMKNLTDHLAYLFHRPAGFGKKGLVVVTTAGSGEKGVARYLRAVLGHWGINGARIITHKAQTVEFTLTGKEQLSIDAAADAFHASVHSRRAAAPAVGSIVVHNAFRAMAAATSPISPIDAEYWRESGFANKVYPTKVNGHGWLIGNLIYKILRRVFK